MTKKKQKKPRQLPVDETEFLQIIDNISKKLAYKFKFGYHNFEDMKQQISIFALEGLSNYDKTRPLENFLWTHVRNRLFNYKRDNYQRPDKPCLTCPLYQNTVCTKYTNKNDCDLYSQWNTRNNSKKNLMHLLAVDEIKDYGNIFEDNLVYSVENKELLNMLDASLNGEERTIYLKVKSGSKVSKQDMTRLTIKIKQILDLNHE